MDKHYIFFLQLHFSPIEFLVLKLRKWFLKKKSLDEAPFFILPVKENFDYLIEKTWLHNKKKLLIELSLKFYQEKNLIRSATVSTLNMIFRDRFL